MVNILMKVNVSEIKAFNDNYIWAIGADDTNKIALVDPGQAKPCIDYINENSLSISAILITHHHADHIGAINELIELENTKGNKVTVYGPKNENIPHCQFPLKEKDSIHLDFLSLDLSIVDLPGHTLGHIAYYNDDMLFCGDTLFSAGCGRIFEGTAEQMYASLSKLSSLPDQTKVYCAHEYTQANIHFALAVEPNNKALNSYASKVKALRESAIATIPSTIALEKQINPFLRSHSSEIIESVKKHNNQLITAGIETFTAIRKWKDTF